MKKQPTIKELQTEIEKLERKLSHQEDMFRVLTACGVIPEGCVIEIERVFSWQRNVGADEYKQNIAKK